MEKTEPQPMTEAEITQANIDAWLIIRRTAWNQFVTAEKQLRELGWTPKPDAEPKGLTTPAFTAKMKSTT